MTYQDGKQERCLGYLMNFKGKGIYEPTFGKVDVTDDEAEKHNAALSEAEVEGLKERCEIGQGGNFYVAKQADDRYEVRTWIGTVIALTSHKMKNGKRAKLTFFIGEKRFEGWLSPTNDVVFFKRIA
jgi:hypothetical protein